MAESQISLMDFAQKHVHIAEEVCPWCEQPIPHEKFAEISSRIEAREKERLTEVTADLQEQFKHEKAETEKKSRDELEQVRSAGLAAVEKLRAESVVSVAAARVAGMKEAEAVAQEKLAEAERTQRESEIAFQAKIAEVEQAKNAAEQLGVNLNNRLEQVRSEDAQTIELLKQESAAKETAAREEGRQGAEAAMQERLAEAERLKAEAEETKQTVLQELDQLKQDHEAIVNERVQEVREALEKDKTDALNAEKAKAFEENLKLTSKVQELPRQLDNKSAEELGEGAEIDLYEALRAEFPEDRIDRVGKGAPGADIIHVVVHNGKDCGKIIYDSKNRNAWRSDYVTKLAQDQMAAKAEHAVLSTHKFPAGERQLCVQDGIILANPARVVALVQVLRKHILQGHTLRLSNEARTQKTAALYDFITSERCLHLFERIDTHTEAMLDLEVKEKKAHDANWKHRGELIRSVQRVRAEISSEIDQIIGTASTLEETL